MPVDLFDRPSGRNRQDDGVPEETVEGALERIVFAGEDGSFTVARLRVEGQVELVTIVGPLAGVPAGATVRVTGKYEHTARFGMQFRVLRYTEVAPATVAGIRKYLGSGLIKGIGPEFARRIVDRFGIDTLEILDRDPSRISEVPGIGPSRARSIREAWARQQEVRKVMVFLQGYGVSPAFAARIYKRYGVAAIAKVRENPYRLAADVWGIGFLSADKLAAALGIAKEAPARAQAGVRHLLTEGSENGHVYLPRTALVAQARELLGVDEPLIQAAIEQLGRDGELAIEALDTEPGEAVFNADLHRAEAAVAAGMAALARGQASRLEIDVERALAWYEKDAGITLARQQAEAVRQALLRKVLVVTGGPGVGKTTIVRGIVSILDRKRLRISLAAPTGRAAKRLSESTGFPAATLHRLLEWRPADGTFGRNRENPLPADLLVVDEASMLDVRLAADVLAALSPSARLLLVGDVDQLPSVGPGTVLRDVIGSGVVPTVRLTEIFRQAAESLIVTNAHRIHDGFPPELGAAPEDRATDRRDFFFLEVEEPAAAAELVRDLVTRRLPRRYGLTPHEIQVLTPMHRGDLGAANLNALLQEALTGGSAELRRGGRVFRSGDRVMQIRNDYDKDVFNGDVGRVERIDADEGAVWVRFDDREVDYASDELDELTLAYAATVHKSQGSEYPAVVIPVHTQHYVMLQRNLLYTAVTRGRKLVVLVGTRKALGMAVRNAEIAARCSRLAWRLARAAAAAA